MTTTPSFSSLGVKLPVRAELIGGQYWWLVDADGSAFCKLIPETELARLIAAAINEAGKDQPR